MITVAGQMFMENEKELDNSNQTIKNFEDYSSDTKIKKDILDKVRGNHVEEFCSGKNEIYKNNSINGFNKNLIFINCELQSNKNLVWEKVSIKLY